MLLLAAALFVGNQPCRICHAAISDAYARTPMARSSGRAESVPPAQFTAAGHKFRISGDRLFFDEGGAPLEYFIGSGAAGRSFLWSRDGFLYELPVTWYSRQRLWDASPGFEHDREVRLNRPIEPSCLQCHASRLRPVLGTQNRYGDPPFLDNGVSCERCHGPGGEHIRDPAASPMVNPARLAPARRDSVCAQCHLTGEARIERPGRRLADFRPGDDLAEFATYFVWNPAPEELKATSHVEKLLLSACKRASGDALWCGTCHEPHTNADRTQSACLGCHQSAHHREDACAGCHMPKSAVSGGGHGVLTDHEIRIPGRRRAASARKELASVLGAADERSLGLAYAELGDARAREHLLRAQPAGPDVLVRLAGGETNPQRAVSLYEAALAGDPANQAALVNLGVLYARSGRLEQARQLWQKALGANPALEQAALNLANILPVNEARELLRRYLDLNPDSRAARERMRQLAPN